MTISFCWFVLFAKSHSILLLSPGLLLFGSGISLIFTPCSVTALSRVSADKRGVASAVGMFLRQLGSSWGMAGFGILFLQTQENLFSAFLLSKPETEHLNPTAFEGLLSQSPFALEQLKKLPAVTGELIEISFSQAYLAAFSHVNLLAAGIAILGLICTWCFIEKKVTLI